MNNLAGIPKHSMRAYTLLELLVVLVISGMLVVLALGSYDRYIKRANREEAKVHLSRIAAELASVKLRRLSVFQGVQVSIYKDPSVLAVLQQVSSQNAYYRFDMVESSPASQGHKIRAMPIADGKQVGNGLLWLDHLGLGCWFDGEDRPDEWQHCDQGRYW